MYENMYLHFPIKMINISENISIFDIMNRKYGQFVKINFQLCLLYTVCFDYIILTLHGNITMLFDCSLLLAI
jgi:hypothetical protein